jgi:hypothetical protein
MLIIIPPTEDDIRNSETPAVASHRSISYHWKLDDDLEKAGIRNSRSLNAFKKQLCQNYQHPLVGHGLNLTVA